MLPGPLTLAEVHGARLLISVWDDDDEEKGDTDDPMGRREEKINSSGAPVARRTLTGVGKLYSFDVSFGYTVVSEVLGRARGSALTLTQIWRSGGVNTWPERGVDT